MATILVSANVLDGNLGDGWIDNADTADALADYMTATWENDLKSYLESGHEVTVEISVQYRTTGYNGTPQIYIDGDDVTETEVELSLTPDSVLWDRFCRSAEYKHLHENN